MANTKDLEQQLAQKEAAYNQKIKEGGTLASDLSKAWEQAGAPEMNALKNKQTELLTNYVAAYPTARENLQNVWNPFTRDRIAAEQVQTTYRPLADIQNEFAVRAKALNLATQSATGLYQSNLQSMQNDIGFTQNAYQRALQKEQAAKNTARSSRGGGSTRAVKAEDSFNSAYDFAKNLYNSSQDKKTEDFWTEQTALPKLSQKFGSKLSPEQLNWILYEARKETWGN